RPVAVGQADGDAGAGGRGGGAVDDLVDRHREGVRVAHRVHVVGGDADVGIDDVHRGDVRGGVNAVAEVAQVLGQRENALGRVGQRPGVTAEQSPGFRKGERATGGHTADS